MDIEHCIEGIIESLKDSDESQWIACYLCWEASNSGYQKWAELISQACGIGDDQARNKRNAYVAFLELASLESVDDILEHLTFSHFQKVYTYLDSTDTYQLIEIMKLACGPPKWSVKKFAGHLEGFFGDDPIARYHRQLDRWILQGMKLYGLSEMNHVPQHKREAMRALLKEME